MVLIYLIMAVICFLIAYNKTRDALHPITVLPSVWYLMASISSLQLGTYQTSWLFETHIMVIVSGILYTAAGMLVAKRRTEIKDTKRTINTTYILLTRCLFVFCLIYTYKVFVSRGMDLLYFRQISGTDIKAEVYKGLSEIRRIDSYIINFLPFCALFSIFELLFSNKKERHLIYNIVVIAVVIAYCMFILHSRGTLLYIVLGTIFIVNRKKKIPFKYLLLAGAGVIIALGLFMMNRTFHGSIIYTGVRGVNNLILSSTYNYIAYCFQNFNDIVADGCRYNIFANVGQSLYKVLGIYNENNIIKHEINNVYNAVGWLSPFYDDLGFLGIVFYPGIIGFILTMFYNKTRNNKYYILILASLQKAIFVPFFGNYFLTAFSVMLPYFLIWGVCFLSKQVNLIYYKIRFQKFKGNIAGDKGGIGFQE